MSHDDRIERESPLRKNCEAEFSLNDPLNRFHKRTVSVGYFVTCLIVRETLYVKEIDVCDESRTKIVSVGSSLVTCYGSR